MRRIIAIPSFAIFTAALAWSGDITPPAGPVSPTMKPLSQVEPRTAISQETTPGGANSKFRITQPGSYYLAGNVIASPNKHGIEVLGDQVTIDLCGFAVLGDGSPGSGITLSGNNCSIFNGVIQGWGSYGVIGSGSGNRVDRVSAVDNGAAGIQLGGDARMTDCTAKLNGANGISVGSTSIVERCVSAENGTLASHIGINAGDRTIVTGCIAEGNSGIGIRVNQSGRVINCQASDNNIGIAAYAGGFITGALCQLNSNDGIAAGPDSTVTGCQLISNGDDGLQLDEDGVATDNHSQSNGPLAAGAGIYVVGSNCRIENNQLISNKYGVLVTGGEINNFIVKNTARNNSGGNFSMPAGQDLAPVISDPGASGFSTATPWSNFAY